MNHDSCNEKIRDLEQRIEELVNCLVVNCFNVVIEAEPEFLDWLARYMVERGSTYTEGNITVRNMEDYE